MAIGVAADDNCTRAPVAENTFDSGILWNGYSIRGGEGLNSIRGIQDCEGDINEY